MHTPRLTLRRLAFLVAAAYAPTVFAAPAARVEFSTSEPIIVGADGRERPARKGEQIVPGDRIQTRAGRAQLAFTDGSFVSLQPNTDFGVSEYNFKGSNDGSEKSVMSLLKGALRTVTGLIGRSKRDAYLMTTPTATIGIRGTGGRIEVNERGTLVAGTSGTWFMSTPGGTLDIPAGSAGFAGPNPNQAPQTTSGGPATPPAGTGTAGTGQPVYVAADQVGSTGTPNVVPPAPLAAPKGMADGTGYGVAFAGPSAFNVSNPVSATFSNNGTILSSWGGSANAIGTAQVLETGNDGIIGWGRWTNGAITLLGSPVSLSADQGMHYAVGVPTASMPTTGSATYSVLGSTKPTLMGGGTTPGSLVSASLSVNFGLSTLDYSVLASIGGQTYGASGTNQVLSGAVNIYTGTSYSGSACSCSGCSSDIKLLFTGSSAQRAGMIYMIDSVTGVVVFSR